MYVLIGGAGMMGSELAKTLLQMGHMIAVVDTDSLACQYATVSPVNDQCLNLS